MNSPSNPEERKKRATLYRAALYTLISFGVLWGLLIFVMLMYEAVML